MTKRTETNELPDWFPNDRIIGPAFGGGFIVQVSNVSKEAKRLEKEGWRITPSGRRHIWARQSTYAD